MADTAKLDVNQLPPFIQPITGTLSTYDIIPPQNASMIVPTEVDQIGRDAQSFDDAVTHSLVSWVPLADRTIKLMVSLTATDTTNTKSADWQDFITLSTFGGTVTIIDGGLGALNYSPNTATWNTITAIPVGSGANGNFHVEVTGLAATVIRWVVAFRILGTQGR